MNRTHHARRAVILAALAVAAFSLAAKEKGEPGKIRDGVLDEIDLATTTAPAKGPLILRRFDASKADPGTAKEGDNQKRTDAVSFIKSEGPRMIAETLLADLPAGAPFPSVSESKEPAPPGALVLEGTIDRIDPGSRAKRYWAGFGAGKSGITVSGRLLDAQGTVLATFRHTRNSGIGIGGGDYVKFLSDDTRDAAHDIAQFLKRWLAGGDLSKEAE